MKSFFCLGLLTLLLSTQFTARSQTFSKFTNTAIEAQPNDWFSAVPIDIDNDYFTDISLSGNGPEAYFNQIDSLTFVYKAGANYIPQTATTCISASWVDMDNDCDLDVFFPARTGAVNYLYRNDGNAVFTRITTGALVNDVLNAETASWGDYDQDGLVDVFICRQNTVSSGLPNWIYKNNGNFSFTKIDTGATAFYSRPSSSANWVDIDNDNDLDLFVVNRNYSQNELYINMGNGRFVENDVSMLTNSSSYSVGADWGDFNNDGYQDVFIACVLGDNNQLYFNNGDLTFTRVTTGNIVNDGGNTHGGVWADFDNDGDLDIHTGNSSNMYPKNNILYLNNGDSTFTKVTTGPQFTELKNTIGNSAVDLNRDGHIDIIDANRYGSAISIFLNNGNYNNFAHFSLKGSTSNKSAVGTRVVVKSTMLGKQTRAVNMQTGYNSQSDFSLHFGLGQDTIIDSMWVYWPSGNQCVFTNIAANSFYNLGEANCSLDTATNALFTYSSLFLNTQFTNQSSGSISNYAWDFGDGSTSTLTNPKHRYNAPGKYLVTLTAFDGYCKHSVYADSIEVCPDTSSATFTYTQNGTSLVFSDASNMLAHSYAWTINGASVSSGNSFNYTYTQSGQINVCLTVTDSCYSKSYCETIPLCLDTLDASFSSNTNLFTTNFNTASSNSNLTSLWDFGDGNTLLVQNGSPIQHTYNQPGTYYVCHTISDSCNAFLYCDSVDVCLDPVTANFSFSLNGSVVQFTNLSTGANTYSWDFGDGNQSSGTDPINLFASNGTYTVCLIAENDCTSDTLCIPITVCPGQGTASYTQVKMPNIPLGIQFTSTSTNATSHMWTFGDGSSSVNANPLKIYAAPGNYNVCLAITDSCGDTDTLCKLINPETISLDENNVLSQVQIYPNPARNHVYIKQSGSEKIQLRLYDLKGKLITEKLFNTDGFNLNLEHLHNGVYVLELKQGIAIRREKLLKY